MNKKRRQIALPSDLFVQLVIHTASADFVLTERIQAKPGQFRVYDENRVAPIVFDGERPKEYKLRERRKKD